MSKIEKANQMIELLNQAEALAKELDISDHERFEGLRYWATLAKEMAEKESKNPKKPQLNLGNEDKFCIIIPYWYANLNKSGVMRRIKVDNAELLDVEGLIGEGGRPRGFAYIFLRFESDLSSIDPFSLRAKLYSESMRLSKEVPLRLAEDSVLSQKAEEALTDETLIALLGLNED